MNPLPGAVETKVAESLWDYVRRWFASKRELQKRIEFLEAELAEAQSGKLAFEKMMNELECRTADDHMYWKQDGKGGPYCPLCLDSDKKRVALIHTDREGSFYCNIHKQHFHTEALRQHDRQAVIDRAQDTRRSNRFGPNSWMV